MKKETFIHAIEALEKQIKYDILIATKLSEAFTNSYSANLMPDNHFISNALLKVLQENMNDNQLCEYGQSWIEYYCFELDFGKENWRLKVTVNGKEIPLSNASQLYDFLSCRSRKA
jgi:hypothetical protein